jgi:hypothetical protein
MCGYLNNKKAHIRSTANMGFFIILLQNKLPLFF